MIRAAATRFSARRDAGRFPAGAQTGTAPLDRPEIHEAAARRLIAVLTLLKNVSWCQGVGVDAGGPPNPPLAEKLEGHPALTPHVGGGLSIAPKGVAPGFRRRSCWWWRRPRSSAPASSGPAPSARPEWEARDAPLSVCGRSRTAPSTVIGEERRLGDFSDDVHLLDVRPARRCWPPKADRRSPRTAQRAHLSASRPRTSTALLTHSSGRGLLRPGRHHGAAGRNLARAREGSSRARCSSIPSSPRGNRMLAVVYTRLGK
jgi:hypothetical protein